MIMFGIPVFFDTRLSKILNMSHIGIAEDLLQVIAIDIDTLIASALKNESFLMESSIHQFRALMLRKNF